MYDGIRHYLGILNFREGIIIRIHRRNLRINNVEISDIEKAPIPTIIVEYFDKEDDCPICMEKLNGKLGHLECNHYFHEECLKKWLETSPNSNCPICRKN